MINIQKYLPTTDTWFQNKKYTIEGDNFYFIDTNIWFQGRLQPPRVICFTAFDTYNCKAVFYDEDYNMYETEIKDIYDDENDLNEVLKEKQRIYNKKFKLYK